MLIALVCENEIGVAGSRFLRAGIARLYLELFSLRRKVAVVQSKAFDAADEEGQAVIAGSINRSLRRLHGAEKPDLGSSDAAYDRLVAAFSQMMPGEVADLSAVIERLSARPNLRRMLKELLALDALKAQAVIENLEVVMVKNRVGASGIFIGGDVGDGNKFVTGGNTEFINSTIAINKFFAPIEAALKAAPNVEAEAIAKLDELKAEAAKGKKADNSVMAKLIDGVVGLVPGAVSAIVGAFGTPILAGIAGPLTKAVLDKIHGK